MSGNNHSCADPTADHDTAPIDIDMLDRTFGEDGRTEIIDTFITHCSVLLEKLSSAIDARDAILAKDMTHQLKGMSASVYAYDFSKKSLAMENIVKQEPIDWEALKQSLPALLKLFEDIKDYLGTVCDTTGPATDS